MQVQSEVQPAVQVLAGTSPLCGPRKAIDGDPSVTDYNP